MLPDFDSVLKQREGSEVHYSKPEKQKKKKAQVINILKKLTQKQKDQITHHFQTIDKSFQSNDYE